jgi:hypothetical protein
VSLKLALLGFLLAIAVVSLMTAWWRYPAENHFSILRCTISFLGSPDANRNPDGWRFYQAGMTALLLLLFNLAWERHERLRGRIGAVAGWSSAAMFTALTLILLAVWIPDTRAGQLFGLILQISQTFGGAPVCDRLGYANVFNLGSLGRARQIVSPDISHAA